MASKRDLLQAHQFLAQRAISALVTREPDPEQPPFRRPGGAAIGSIVLAILALVAVGVYGLVKPGGNTTWRDRPAVIVAKETGARYVYLNGVLHPVANYASALLALGERAETVSVSRNSLAGVPRGPEIGIPGAPDALPGPEQLLTGGWSLCSRPVPDPSGSTVDESVLLVGAGAPGGRPAGAALAEVPASGDQYLIADGYRHRIRQADTVTVGLALQSVPRTRTAMAVVDVLPAGEPIAPIRTAGAGGSARSAPPRA
ncbi:type VII secretion protein EccB, partial [Amycolatopsis thermalba]|uniref:type VII secretion protein EccB n=1 Tax=Amycolatopsis thermalba TaxID=944492 RepID=UPI000E25EEC4